MFEFRMQKEGLSRARPEGAGWLPLQFAAGCVLQGRKINFTNSKTLVGRCRERDARHASLRFFSFYFSCFFFACVTFHFDFSCFFFACTQKKSKKF